VSVLPFRSRATLHEQGGAAVDLGAVDTVKCSIWPASGRNVTDTGQTFDHRGEAAPEYEDALRVRNRELRLDGVRYKIVEAVAHPDGFPHVALFLRSLTGG
jgi:hypothetical protein